MTWAMARMALLLAGVFFVMDVLLVRGGNPTSASPNLHIIYASRDDAQAVNLYALAVDRDESQPLDLSYTAAPVYACSTNGAYFAYMQGFQLHVIGADGTHRQINERLGQRVHSLTISNDGSYAIVSVVNFTSLNLGVVRIPEGSVRWFSSGLFGSSPRLSFDETRIVFNVNNNPPENALEIYVMNVNGSNLRRISTAASDAVWLSDNQSLAYIDNSDLYMTDLLRGISVPLTRNVRRSYAFYPALSPDGSQLAYLAVPENGSELRLYVADSNGKHARALTTDEALMGRSPCFLTFSPSLVLASALSGT